MLLDNFVNIHYVRASDRRMYGALVDYLTTDEGMVIRILYPKPINAVVWPNEMIYVANAMAEWFHMEFVSYHNHHIGKRTVFQAELFNKVRSGQ